MVLEKTLESPLDCKEIQPINPKGNQPWIVIGRTDAKAETPILWPSDVKNWLTGKDPDSGEDWRQEKKGTTKDEMVGWHHQLDGHEFEQGGQGSWWCTGKPGMLQSMGLQRVRQDRVTELNWTEKRLRLRPPEVKKISVSAHAQEGFLGIKKGWVPPHNVCGHAPIAFYGAIHLRKKLHMHLGEGPRTS